MLRVPRPQSWFPGDGTRSREDRRAAPRRGRVTIRVFLSRAGVIDIIASREDNPVDALNDVACGCVIGHRAGGNVTHAHEDRVGAWGGVERPGGGGGGSAIANRYIPFERLTSADVHPGCGRIRSGHDAGILRDLGEHPTGIRPPEERDGQWSPLGSETLTLSVGEVPMPVRRHPRAR